MTPESMIFDVYGVRIRSVPRDGLFRNFRINELHNGFLMAADDGAIFGSIIYGERWIVIPGWYKFFDGTHNDSPKIRREWLIWEAARSMLERGERLSTVDRERLALAVQRLEEWL